MPIANTAWFPQASALTKSKVVPVSGSAALAGKKQFRRASIGKSLISDGWNVKRVIILRGSGLFKLRSAQVFAHFKVGIVIAEG